MRCASGAVIISCTRWNRANTREMRRLHFKQQSIDRGHCHGIDDPERNSNTKPREVLECCFECEDARGAQDTKCTMRTIRCFERVRFKHALACLTFVLHKARNDDACELFKQVFFTSSERDLVGDLEEFRVRVTSFAVQTAHRELQLFRSTAHLFQFIENPKRRQMQHDAHSNASTEICGAGSEISKARMEREFE